MRANFITSTQLLAGHLWSLHPFFHMYPAYHTYVPDPTPKKATSSLSTVIEGSRKKNHFGVLCLYKRLSP